MHQIRYRLERPRSEERSRPPSWILGVLLLRRVWEGEEGKKRKEGRKGGRKGRGQRGKRKEGKAMPPPVIHISGFTSLRDDVFVSVRRLRRLPILGHHETSACERTIGQTERIADRRPGRSRSVFLRPSRRLHRTHETTETGTFAYPWTRSLITFCRS